MSYKLKYKVSLQNQFIFTNPEIKNLQERNPQKKFSDSRPKIFFLIFSPQTSTDRT